jgi:hypothetical protein
MTTLFQLSMCGFGDPSNLWGMGINEQAPKMQIKLSKERALSLITIINYCCSSYKNTHNVDEHKCGWDNDKSSPLDAYSSPKSLSAEALDVTLKFVLIHANILINPWKITNKWAQTPPIIQNCSLFHHSSIPTLDHGISKRHVAKIDRNR